VQPETKEQLGLVPLVPLALLVLLVPLADQAQLDQEVI
jgi:hypothetical protein